MGNHFGRILYHVSYKGTLENRLNSMTLCNVIILNSVTADEFVIIDLLPGDTVNIALLLSNFGKDATFTLQVTPTHHNSCKHSTAFSYSVLPQHILVKTNETVEAVATVVSLSRDAINCEIPATTLVVTASLDDNQDRSDFVTFMVSQVSNNCEFRHVSLW